MAARKHRGRTSSVALAIGAVVVATIGLTAIAPPTPAGATPIFKTSVVLASKTSSQVTILVGGLRKDLKLQPTAQVIPVVANDDPYVSTAFLYNPGKGKDGLLSYWIAGGKIQSSFKEFPVDGYYRPTTQLWGDIFWYGEESARDFSWDFDATGSAVTSTPRTLGGRYQFIPWQSRMCCDSVHTDSATILYAPGTARDEMWVWNDDGTHRSVPFTINGTYRPLYGWFVLDGLYEGPDLLWYSQTGPEYVWSPTTDVTKVSSYRVGDIGPGARPVVGQYYTSLDYGYPEVDTILWYFPGPKAETYWVEGSAFGDSRESPMLTFPAGSINGDYRPLAYGPHDVLFLGSGTTAQLVHLTDEGPSGSITLTGLPPGAIGYVGSLAQHG